MYDIIGDIHGYAKELKSLLKKLGYQERDGVWQHAECQAIFVGDIIDRGPEQQHSIDIVRSMVEAGSAQAVMGNHEFNAVTWTLPDPDKPGAFLRPHNDKNHHQHQAFLEQLGEGSKPYRAALDWFKTLPLWLDLDGLRVIHACWHPSSIDLLRPHLDDQNRLLDSAWYTLGKKGTEEFEALEIVLKGFELELPEGAVFYDADGHPRRRIRTRWWDNSANTYRGLARVAHSQIDSIPDSPAPLDTLPRYANDKPLFVGHYWLNGTPEPLSNSIACVDYSVAAAKGDRKMCAYRWRGEAHLNRDHYVWVA
ncbi:metallophosphoesterase [gamma proteobacterium HTCC5015]|nr:metallophosphoesterase [gamma proteobacterium HTCC5015]